MSESLSEEQFRAAIELSRRPGIGAAKFKSLVDQYGSPAEAFRQSFKSESDSILPKKNFSRSQVDSWWSLLPSIGFTYYGASDYPKSLALISEPPPYLFRKGALWPMPAMAIGIVGPRNCSKEGAYFARKLAARLSALGVLIVSGSASGIDSAAHQGASEGGGSSSLVTAAGIDIVYPKENQMLFSKVAKQGCILTELLPSTPPRFSFFPTRNRIIVGIADAMIFVEGKLGSGTATSVEHALRQKRPIFTWMGSPRQDLRELPEKLLEHGAIPLQNEDPEAILEKIVPRLV
ncbi:DNA processing protein [Gammaproteobacteria bacterium]